MSVPFNHHYVSQCQIHNFFNSEGLISLYDKSLNNFYNKKSSKGIFSEKFSNSIYREGLVDHRFLEEDLKIFEDEFPSAVAEIKVSVRNKFFSHKGQDALNLVAFFGIIGEMRNPFRKKSHDYLLNNLFTGLSESFDNEYKKSFDRINEYKKHVTYSNRLTYSDLAFRTYELMGGFDFQIWLLESSDCFLLPDTTGTQVRGNLGNIPNPLINQITQVGIPITDKIFIHVISKKLNKGSFLKRIKKDNDTSVEQINLHIFQYAYRTVATSNMEYLKKTVSKSIKQ